MNVSPSDAHGSTFVGPWSKDVAFSDKTLTKKKKNAANIKPESSSPAGQ